MGWTVFVIPIVDPFNPITFIDFTGGALLKKMVICAFLEKIARHLMLLACMTILAKASGWLALSQTSILLLIAFASAAHLSSRAIGGIREKGL